MNKSMKTTTASKCSPSWTKATPMSPATCTKRRFRHRPGRLEFQFGAVKENGVNGLTSEALLAILIHRTRTLNDRFPSAHTVDAMAGLNRALRAFDERTADRLARKVEGEEKA